MNYYKCTTILALSIALSCNAPAAMKSAPLHKQKKEDQKQVSLRQAATPALEEFLPKVLAALVRDYLPRDYHAYRHYKTIKTKDRIDNYQWSCTNKYLLTCHATYATLWDTHTGEPLSEINYTYTQTPRGCLHPNNLSLLIIDNNENVQLHDFTTSQVRTLNASYSFYKALFNHNGDAIIAHYKSKNQSQEYIGSFATSTGALVTSKEIKSKDTAALLALSSDNSRIAFATDQTAYLISPDMKQQIPLSGHRDYVCDICFTYDNTHVLTASWDATARIWQAASGKCLRTFKHLDWLQSIHVSPENSTFIVGGFDGTIRLAKPKKNKFFTLAHDSKQYYPTFFSDTSLIAARNHCMLYLWKDPEDVREKLQPTRTCTSINKNIPIIKRRRKK